MKYSDIGYLTFGLFTINIDPSFNRLLSPDTIKTCFCSLVKDFPERVVDDSSQALCAIPNLQLNKNAAGISTLIPIIGALMTCDYLSTHLARKLCSDPFLRYMVSNSPKYILSYLYMINTDPISAVQLQAVALQITCAWIIGNIAKFTLSSNR